MATQNFFYIGILDETEDLISVFNGNDYVADSKAIKLFPQSQKPAALQEAGLHQARNTPIGQEVKLFKVSIDIPDVVIKTKEEQGLDTLPSADTADTDTDEDDEEEEE